MNESMIRDINLAEEGKQRIAWVEKFMPVLKYTERRILR